MSINSDWEYDNPSLKSEETKTPPISGWRPAYLRKRVLILFLIWFCGMIAAVEAIHQVSSAHFGVASSTESRHYTWTYGPTAILTIVAVFWSRVEFQTKQNAPWQSMLGGPQEPRRSVLLDYISEMQPVSLYKAVKNKHPLVAASVACSMLMQLLIIFSTSLFSLQQVRILRRDIPVQVQGSIHSLNSSILETVKAQPFDIINGILFANVSYPSGTTRDLTFQTFSVSNLSSDAIVTTDVSGISAYLDCEPAHIQTDLWQERRTLLGSHCESLSVVEHNQIFSSSCKMSNVSINMPHDPGTCSSGTSPGSYYPTTKPHYAARFFSGQCDGMSGPDGNRIVVVLAEGQYGEERLEPIQIPGEHRRDINFTPVHWHDFVPTGTMTATRNITLKRSVQMICKPTYSLLKLQANANTTGGSLTADLATMTMEQSILPNLTAWDIANNIITAPTSWGPQEPIEHHDPFAASKPYDNNLTDFRSPNYTFDSIIDSDYPLRLGAWLANATGRIDNLFQPGVLHSTASSYYGATAAQLVQKGLAAQEEQLLTNSSAFVVENRVVMNQMPLRAIEICLALAVLLAVVMTLLVPRDVLAPWSPNYISAIAMVMANSKAFCKPLKETSAAPLKVLAGRLEGRRYYSDVTAEGLSITTVDDKLQAVTRKDSSMSDWPAKSREWKPLPNLFLRILFFITVALVIGALEVLLHLSQANEGLGDASSFQVMHYLWTMLPATIMQGIGIVFSSIDFNTRCLAPYAHLKRRNYTTFRPFMTVNFLDSLDATLIVNSIRLKHYAVLATTLATLISPFLTIITSSLYSTVDVPQRMNVSFTEETTFSGTNSGDKGILIANYILRDNLTTPRWTDDELAFPKLATNTRRENSINTAFVDIRVRAMRATLDCHTQIYTDLQPHITETGTLKVNVPRGQCSASGTNLSLNLPLDGIIAASNNTVFGKAFGPVPISYGEIPWDKLNISTHSGAVLPMNKTLDFSKVYGGNSVSYIWGSLGNDTIDHIAGVVCCKSAETVDTQTRFQLPTFNAVDGHPPLPDENSTRPAENYTEPRDWAGLDAEELNLDSFFQALVYGKYAIPEGDLGDPEKNEKVHMAITRQHKLFKAQLFNSYSRVPVNGTEHPSSLRGNVTTAGHLRVFQDAVATRVLEALLAAMLLFGIVGSVILNTDRVLPKNPCSIAAVASLLVDSDLLSRYEGFVGDPNDKDVGQALFANCRFFSEWSKEGALDEPTKDKFIIRLVDDTKEEPPEGWI